MKKELPTRPQLPPTFFSEFDRSSMTCLEVMDNVKPDQVDEAIKQGFTIIRNDDQGATMSRTVRFTM